MDPSDKRHTKIDMLALIRAKSPSQTSESAILHGSLSPSRALNSNAPNKKRARSPEDLNAVTDTGQVKLKTLRSATTGTIRLRVGSPWESYEKIYDLQLGGPVEVAIRRASPVQLVQVRMFAKAAAEKTLHMFRHTRHPAIVAVLDAFTNDEGLYIVLEHMPVSLEHLVRSPAYPNERQLAAILGQILNGVAYLTAEGLEHGSLCCSNILLNTDGDVKIANQDCCHAVPQSKSGPRNLRALSCITMELMQKYVKEDGAIGIDDLHRWHSSSDAVGFLSGTTSVTSSAELLKHPLLALPWQKESLIGLISLAQVCSRGNYKYEVQM